MNKYWPFGANTMEVVELDWPAASRAAWKAAVLSRENMKNLRGKRPPSEDAEESIVL